MSPTSNIEGDGPDIGGERVAVLALGRPTFDVPFAETMLADAWALLKSSGATILGEPRLLMDGEAVRDALDVLATEAPSAVLVLQITFTDAAASVRIAERFGNLPIAIWAMPEPREGGRLRLNAFCGLNLAAHALGLMDRVPGVLYAAPTPDAILAVRELIAGSRVPRVPPIGPAEVAGVSPEAARASNAIHGARIGRIGEHPEGFHTCAYDARRLDALARVHVEPIALDDAFAAARAVPNEMVEDAREIAQNDCGDLGALDPGELDASLRLYGALTQLRSTGGFDAFAVRCWPECFTEHGGAMCGPVSMMGERGVPCACEADVYGALSSLLMQSLSDAPAFLVDLVDLDAADGTGVVWHCGQAPISMSTGARGPTSAGAEGPTDAGAPGPTSAANAASGGAGEATGSDMRPRAAPTVHTNRRMALLYEFALRPGRVTLARISQARGRHQMVITGAEMLERPMAFTGTSGVLRFDTPIAGVLEGLIGAGVEHHLALAYGDHRQHCREVAAELGLPVLSL